jgi:hypothetical protein
MKDIQRLLARIDKELDGLELEAKHRNNLSAALFDVAIEHSKSIIILFTNNLYASSYALVRPMFESFVRAAWIQHCASDKQIEKLIKKDTFPLNLGQMLEAVEQEQDWVETLSIVKKNSLKNMHSYTHGGMQIIARRFNNDELFHSADPKEVGEIVKLVALLAFLSFNRLVYIAKTSDKNDAIKEMYDDMCQWCFPEK